MKSRSNVDGPNTCEEERGLKLDRCCEVVVKGISVLCLICSDVKTGLEGLGIDAFFFLQLYSVKAGAVPRSDLIQQW